MYMTWYVYTMNTKIINGHQIIFYIGWYYPYLHDMTYLYKEYKEFKEYKWSSNHIKSGFRRTSKQMVIESNKASFMLNLLMFGI